MSHENLELFLSAMLAPVPRTGTDDHPLVAVGGGLQHAVPRT
jgi:hypothetical protein